MTNGALQSTITQATIWCAVEQARFAFSFFSFSAANGAGDAMV